MQWRYSLCFESLNFKINFRAINFLDHRIVRKALNYHGGATQCVKQNNEPATLSDDLWFIFLLIVKKKSVRLVWLEMFLMSLKTS